MSRTAPARVELGADKLTTSNVLALVQAIERHGPVAPAAVAFRSALRRAGLEADAAGGLRALDDLLHAVADADPGRADARTAIIRTAWADLLPGLGGRARA